MAYFAVGKQVRRASTLTYATNTLTWRFSTVHLGQAVGRDIALQLMVDESGGIPIPADDCIREAWIVQYDRAVHSGSVNDLRERLAGCFAVSLTECLDTDLKPPTEAQIRYAMDIARDLGVALPSEALRFRGAMTEFIKRFADTFKQKRLDYLKAE